MTDLEDYIRTHLPPARVGDVPEVLLHAPGAASRLGGFLDHVGAKTPPYWAYPWAGGTALARHVLDHPQTVRGRRVVDVGAGSGLVAIAAMKSGAAGANACEMDAVGRVAVALNAGLNGVEIEVSARTAMEEFANADLMLAGDVFYDDQVATGMATLFEIAAQQMPVLIGDPYRRALPLGSMELLAEYEVHDFASGDAKVRAGVFRWVSH